MIKIQFVCLKIYVLKIHFITKYNQIKEFVNNVQRIVNALTVLFWMIIVQVVMKRVNLINYNMI
jgi:hypothetical protein